MDAAFPAHLSNRDCTTAMAKKKTTGDISTVSAEAQVTDTHNDNTACNDEKKAGGAHSL